MPKRDTHAPKHRAPVDRTARPRKAIRNSVVLSSVAVAATGMTVSGGVLSSDAPSVEASEAGGPDPEGRLAAADVSEQLERRADDEPVSRSDRRTEDDRAKRASLDVSRGGAITRTKDLEDADPREIGRALLPEYGFSADQFSCLDQLYVSESDWEVDADNPTSSAYGIPQALTQLHDLPADYMTNPITQIRWGLEYIKENYGTPCNAWSFKQGHNWY